MQRYKVIITDEVFRQLEQILDFVASQSVQNASQLLDRLLAAMLDLDHMPGRFRVAETKRFPNAEIHRGLVPPFKILYVIDKNAGAVTIVNLHHGAMDVE